MTDLLDTQIYGIIGDSGFERLIAAFYRRVPADPILSQMYDGRDLAGAEVRLRDFLVMRFGGPQRYLERRGDPRLRMRHQPFAINHAARDCWLALMEQALAEADLPPAAVAVLRQFFHDAGTFLVNVA